MWNAHQCGGWGHEKARGSGKRSGWKRESCGWGLFFESLFEEVEHVVGSEEFTGDVR
ncbi:hypothetical protein [Rubritalea tangerina]|uniref:hypothetical protein n=1 Tax=Rubritalea tangerina TaxID=430798 RepID=UPI003620CF68